MSTFTGDCCDDKDEVIPSALAYNSESARDIMTVLGAVVDSMQVGMTSGEYYLKEVKARIRRSVSTQLNYVRKSIEQVTDSLSESLAHALENSGAAVAIVQQDAMIAAPDAFAERQPDVEDDIGETYPTTVFPSFVPVPQVPAPALPSTFVGPPEPGPTLRRTGLTGGGQLTGVLAPSITSLLDFNPGSLPENERRSIETVDRMITEGRAAVRTTGMQAATPASQPEPCVPLFPDTVPLPEPHATAPTPATNALINQSQAIVRTFIELLYMAAPEVMRGIETIGPAPRPVARPIAREALDSMPSLVPDNAPDESDIEASEVDV